MKSDVYSRITDHIVAELEKGPRPWHKPWNAGHIAGPISRPLRSCGKPYSGIDVVMLWATAMERGYSAPIWMTFKQALELGAHVRKGEKGALVVYASTFTRAEQDADTGEAQEREIPFLKGYTVFNVEQIEGLPAHYTASAAPRLNPEQRIERAEAFFAATQADIRHGGNSAHYVPSLDYIQMPPFETFRDAGAYYATLKHDERHHRMRGHQPHERVANLSPRRARVQERALRFSEPCNPKGRPMTRTFSTPRNVIVNADCIEAMRSFERGSVDFILTDPPYLVNYRDRNGRKVANDDNTRWLRPAFNQMHRVLKDGGFAVSFYGWNKVDLFMDAWKAAGFRVVGHIVFRKRCASSAKFLRYQHEQAYLLAKGNVSLPENPIPDVIDFPYAGNKLHPTQKPVEALAPLIEAFTKPGDLVLDPFSGSGSTLAAAQQLGRDWIGVELDSRHHQTASRQLAWMQQHNGRAAA